MSRILAIGRRAALAGYGLAGVDVVDAAGPDDVRRAWQAIDDDVSLVLLTPEARDALPERLRPGALLWAVIPE